MLHRPSGPSRSFVLASLRALHLDRRLDAGAFRTQALSGAPHTGNAGSERTSVCHPAVPARSTLNDQVKPTPGRRLRGHEADACDGSRNPGTRTGPTSASTASARRYPAPRRSRPTSSAARWLRRCSPTVTPRVSRAWRRCGATEGSAASEGSDDPVDPRPRRRLRREYVLVEVTADADGDRPVVTGHLDRLPRDGQPLRRPGITGSGIHALDHRRSHSRRRRVLTTRSARSCDV
jgi:hypothetical protein